MNYSKFNYLFNRHGERNGDEFYKNVSHQMKVVIRIQCYPFLFKSGRIVLVQKFINATALNMNGIEWNTIAIHTFISNFFVDKPRVLEMVDLIAIDFFWLAGWLVGWLVGLLRTVFNKAPRGNADESLMDNLPLKNTHLMIIYRTLSTAFCKRSTYLVTNIGQFDECLNFSKQSNNIDSTSNCSVSAIEPIPESFDGPFDFNGSFIPKRK
ncbi:hypothetical protein BLOT_010291, partial [Blomia tropicalis]